MAQDRRQVRIGPVELVQLRMTHPGGELPYRYLSRPRIRQVDLVDDKRLTSLDENRGRRLHS